MEDIYGQLKAFLEKTQDFKLPSYNEIPSVPLYMEQVVEYVNGVLAPFALEGKPILSSFMVNNYVKAKIIDEPNGKKYDRNHIGYLLAISALKNVLPLSDLSLLIEMDKGVSTDKSVLYEFFRMLFGDILKQVVQKASWRIEDYGRRYEKESQDGEPLARTHLQEGLALTALRLSVQSSVEKTMASYLLSGIEDDMHGEGKNTLPGKKEAKYVEKTLEQEAERLSHKKEQAKRLKEKRQS